MLQTLRTPRNFIKLKGYQRDSFLNKWIAKPKAIKPCCNYFAKGCLDCPNPIFISDWCCSSWCEHGEFVLKQYLKLQRPRNRWWWLWLWLLSCIKCSCHAGFNVNNRPSRLLDECRISIWIQESLDISDQVSL